MRIYTLQCEMVTRTPLQNTFKIFEDPGNLGKITPPWLNFRMVSKNVRMRKGAEIGYTISWLGIPLHWRTIIREYQPPHLFIDEQAQGPYALWRHRHTFRETEEGVLVGDHVDYALPLGPLGQVAHSLMVGKQVKGIFEFRQKRLIEMLGGNTRQTMKPIVTSRHES